MVNKLGTNLQQRPSNLYINHTPPAQSPMYQMWEAAAEKQCQIFSFQETYAHGKKSTHLYTDW